VTDVQGRTSAGNEFQIDGAVTENERWVISVQVLRTTSTGAEDDRSVHVGTQVCVRSLRQTPIYNESLVATSARKLQSDLQCTACGGQESESCQRLYVILNHYYYYS